MLKYFFFLFWSVLISISWISSISARTLPFTDIHQTDVFYDAVNTLYDEGIIRDNGDHLFHPNDLMARDFFVSLVVGIGCHKCETPTITDISHYNISPFIDLPKTNRYYYCIAYAKENNIAQGYIPDTTGYAYCEDKNKYESSPFCMNNTITRIEAAAMLLRRAKLWDDTLNIGSFDRTFSIPDASHYWYGYAKKAIEIGIVNQKSGGNIGQDEKITRGEFVMMSSKMLGYTQCQNKNTENTIEAEIGIRDAVGKLIERSTFIKGENFSLVPITGSGDWNYGWTATNPVTGRIITGSGDVFPGSNFDIGDWFVRLDVIDPISGKTVASPSNTIHIQEGKTPEKDIIPCVNLSANPLSVPVGAIIDFSPYVCPNDHHLSYSWDYGDNATSTIEGDTNHAYTRPGVYPVTLTVTDDTTGKTGQSTVLVRIIGDPGIEAEIGIRDAVGKLIERSTFIKGENFSLVPITGSGDWNYGWKAISLTTGETLYGSGNSFDGKRFSVGDWSVTLDVIDPITHMIVASPMTTIHIQEKDTSPKSSLPCVNLDADPLRVAIGMDVDFSAYVCPSEHPLSYVWDYGDGGTSTLSGNTTHVYLIPGVHTVTLTVTDTVTGKTGEARVIITVTGEDDTDGDSIKNRDDKCPLVYAKTISGCPEFGTYMLPPFVKGGTSIFGNLCLGQKYNTVGLLIGTPNCTQCPCDNKISIDAPLRQCDVVFPTIMSPGLDAIYSRGNFYLIQ